MLECAQRLVLGEGGREMARGSVHVDVVLVGESGRAFLCGARNLSRAADVGQVWHRPRRRWGRHCKSAHSTSAVRKCICCVRGKLKILNVNENAMLAQHQFFSFSSVATPFGKADIRYTFSAHRRLFVFVLCDWRQLDN